MYVCVCVHAQITSHLGTNNWNQIRENNQLLFQANCNELIASHILIIPPCPWEQNLKLLNEFRIFVEQVPYFKRVTVSILIQP